MSIKSPQCGTCLAGRPYSKCAGRKNCAHIVMMERALKRLRKEMKEMLDSDGDTPLPKWYARMIAIADEAVSK